MIDTITFALNKQYFNIEKLRTTLNNKFHYKSTKEYVHGKSINYTYDNWNFWLTDNYLKFSGSLTRLILGNNHENASFKEIQNALLKLEEFLEISLKEAKVTRIDLTYTLEMDLPVSNYLQLLLPPKNFKPYIYGMYETIEYRRKGVNSLKFYDKVKEVKDKNKKFDVGDFEWLRYELHVPGSVNRFFAIEDLTFQKLFDRDIYNKLIIKWYEEYLNVPYNKSYSYSSLDCSSLKKFQTSLAMEAVASRGGVQALEVIIDTESISKKTRYDIRSHMKQHFNYVPDASCPKDELDYRMHDAFETSLVC